MRLILLCLLLASCGDDLHVKNISTPKTRYQAALPQPPKGR